MDGASRIAAWESFNFLPSTLLGIMFITIACMSFFSILKMKSVWWVVPQQIILMAMAFGQSKLMFEGHYADWVVRPPYFIYRDQVWGILLAIFHLMAMLLINTRNHLTRLCSKD